jgi:S-adenosylmethionine:tRNA ribosyltransferase-isomerase
MKFSMKLTDYDFELPEELIAQRPASKRDQSRLMIVNRENASIAHDVFANIGNYLPQHPLMVFNDTRVIPAKVSGFNKKSQKQMELILIREREPDVWEALIKGLGKMKLETEFVLCEGTLRAVFKGRDGNRGLFQLIYQGDLRSLLNKAARMPLPPYIRRDPHENEEILKMDGERYQTVYAAKEGAIAAPTAGLHFTPKLLKDIGSGIADLAFLTLHVGIGTFLPIRSQDVRDHQMEKERFIITRETWDRIWDARTRGQKVLAVGTTATRVLESLTFDVPTQNEVSGETEIFIYPGVEFRTVDQLLTNFHLPKSTLFLLVCAFAGTDLMRKAYQEAIGNQYRFFSYGDAMLIL